MPLVVRAVDEEARGLLEHVGVFHNPDRISGPFRESSVQAGQAGRAGQQVRAGRLGGMPQQPCSNATTWKPGSALAARCRCSYPARSGVRMG